MRHATDGELRRMLDEAWAVPASVRSHAKDCATCLERIEAMRSDAAAVESLFTDVPASDAYAARERVTGAAARGDHPASAAAPKTRVRYGPIAGWAAAAATVAALAFTPAGSYAKGLLVIFQPQSFQAVPIGPAQTAGLPKLGALGNIQGVQGARFTPATSLQAAQQAAGYAVLSAGAGLPAGAGAPTYAVMAQRSQSLTLDAAKVAAYAAQNHLKMPPLPADLNGSTLTVTTGPAVVTVYGASLSSTTSSGRVPELLIAQAPAPKVYSTGATVTEIEQYLLSMPGVSPELAAEIRAIGDPTRTLPIPIPVGSASSQKVTVQGAQGLAINDQTGVGSGVVWVKNGMVYAVVGSLPESEILSVAQGLH